MLDTSNQVPAEPPPPPSTSPAGYTRALAEINKDCRSLTEVRGGGGSQQSAVGMFKILHWPPSPAHLCPLVLIAHPFMLKSVSPPCLSFVGGAL